MNASERIAWIKKISHQLAFEEWPIIDLTLRQFGLQWMDQWQGDKNSYVLAMIEATSDAKLLELAHHLGLSTSPAPLAEQDTGLWETGHYRVFISHGAVHKQLATEIQARLRRYRIASFVAHVDIEPVTPWQDTIELALRSCHALVALLTEDFHASKWTDQEVGVAIGRELPILPIRLTADPYGFIGKCQAILGHGKSGDDLGDAIVDVSVKQKQTATRIARLLSEALLHSSSYVTSMAVIDKLDTIQYTDEGILKNIQEAVNNNDQVYNTYTGNFRIAQLLKRLGEVKTEPNQAPPAIDARATPQPEH